MSHDARLTIPGNRCIVHGYHYPRPTRTVRHHIWPQEYGGPTTEENLVWVCDTGHYNIHNMIDWLLGHNVPKPKVTRMEARLADVGFRSIKAKRLVA